MHFYIVSLFPEIFASALSASLLKKARDRDIIRVSLYHLRDYGEGRHRVTDDYPYGGGRGMVMKPEPIINALEDITRPLANPWRILFTPQGALLNQDKVCELAKKEDLVLICGRYEGVDERVKAFIDEEISIGDYVLAGGELPALVTIDAVTRLIPGVVGKPESVQEDSFVDGLLEYPHFTRPEEFKGMRVPAILLSGDHEAIARWRRQEALRRTWERRPDLLFRSVLTEEDRRFLAQLSAGGEKKRST